MVNIIMGNSACLLASSLQSLSEADLTKTKEEDERCLGLLQQLLPTLECGRIQGLDAYKVLGAESGPKTPAKPESQELALLCLQDSPAKLTDKFTDVKTALQGEIKALGSKEPSTERRFKNSRLQVLCRVYDALLRAEERERRRTESLRQADENKKQGKEEKSALPPLARAGLSFGMGTLLRLVERARDPELLADVIDLAASVMAELPPLSLTKVDPGLTKALDSFSQFFQSRISDSMGGLDKTTQLKAATVMLGLALAKGDYVAALALAKNFLQLQSDNEWKAAESTLAPLLNSMITIKSVATSVSWNWNTARLGPDIALSNNNVTITRTNSSAWGNQLSEQSVSEGQYYVEFKVDRNSSSCLLIGIALPTITDMGSKCAFGNCICYQADGDSYCNGSGTGNIGSYTQGDRIGMFIDMDNKKISFYKNGTRMSRDPFDIAFPQASLIICFGGSDQFVSFNAEAEPPSDIASIVSSSKKKEEEKEQPTVAGFPITPEEVLANEAFNAFTKLEGSADPTTAGTFVLTALAQTGEGTFGQCGLDSLQPKPPKNLKLKRSDGMAVAVQPRTFALLLEILELVRSDMQGRMWEHTSFKQGTWAALSAMRLLRNHIFTVIQTNTSEEESGLTAEVKTQIRTVLRFYSTLRLENLGLEASEENESARNALDRAALLVTLHSFEIFYPTLNSQLDYFLLALRTEEMDESEKKVVNDLLKKLCQPANLFRAFSAGTHEDRQRVQAFLNLLLTKAVEASSQLLKGEEAKNEDFVESLYIAVTALFAQVAKTEYNPDMLSLAKEFLGHLFPMVYKLIREMKTLVADGDISEELETRVKKTLLDKHVVTLLRGLSVLKFNEDFSAYLITEMMRLNTELKSLKGRKGELSTIISSVSQVYESEHPYPNSADQTYSVNVPSALNYTLEFDNECKTESGYDYLQLWTNSSKSTELYKWHGNRDQFPSQPLVVQQPELFFTFHSDGGTNYWGWKITITAMVEVTVVKESWIEEMRNTVASLLVALSKNMVAIDSTPDSKDSVLSNRLLSAGISDIGLIRLTKNKPRVSPILAELITTTQTDDGHTSKSAASGLLKMAIAKNLMQNKLELKPNLAAYLSKLSTVSETAVQYCDTPIIEELIAGSERAVAAFEGLKEQAKVAGPLANIGGAELDQAERAVFGVFLTFFELSSSFASLVDDAQEVCSMFQFILKQACQIRPWAQLQRQRLIEASNADVSYADLGKDVVDKCVLLLHTDFKHSLSAIGIEKVLQSLMTTIRRTQTGELGDSKGKTGSRWSVVKKSVVSLSRMKTLQGLRVLRRQPEELQEEDKKQFLAVHQLVMEVLGSSVTSVQLAEELEKRRNKATARCLGLNIMSQAFRAVPEASKGELQGLISTAFASSFLVDSAKRHYSTGTAGSDPYLSSCLQRSFFQLYGLLLNRLQVSAVRDQDCTSESVSLYLLSTLDALSFPFADSDAAHLLELNIREPAQFLLSLAKGHHFYERLEMKFDRSKTIVDLKVVPESEFHAEAGVEGFSLNPKNRLAGEVAEEVEGQQKLVLKVIRGSANADLKPITTVLVSSPEDQLEGMEKVEGNLNELGQPERALFIRRAEPVEGEVFITKVFVSGWDPIDLCADTEPYSSFRVLNVTPEETTKRSKRKDLLRRGAWLLFKLLLFSAAGKFNESAQPQTRRNQLQQLFAALLMTELKCVALKSGSEETLELRKLVSGRNWRSAEIPTMELRVSAMGDWMGRIREDADEYMLQSETKPGYDEISLTDAINFYVGSTDPLIKGRLPASEVSEDLPAEYKNAQGEVDFFCFLKYALAHADQFMGPFWQKYVKTSRLLGTLPADYNEAEKGLGGGTVSSILNAFISTINANEDESFLPYLKLFSEAEQPGLVSKDAAPKNAPSVFFNEDGQLDFFLTFKHITANPDQFPAYFRELKMFTGAYELPSSCVAFYKARLSPAQAEYQASLLLLLYQCCGSKGMLAVLSSPQTVLELLKFMFFGSLKTSTIACRIVKELLASEHSPESFEGLWTSFPKAKLRAEYGAATAADLVLVLLTFIGLKSSIHVKSWKYSFLSLEKIEALSFEAIGFLQSLCKNDRWREHIVKHCLQLTTQALSTPPSESGSEATIGAIGFLKSLDGRRDMFVHEWSRVELKGAGVSQGVLIKHKKDVSKLKLYCEADDALHVENGETFVSNVPESKLSLYSQLPESLVSELFSTLCELVTRLEDSSHLKSVPTVETRINNASVRRLVQSSAIDILAALCETQHSLPGDHVETFAAQLIKMLDCEHTAAFPPALYYQLRKILYARHRTNVSAQVMCTTPAQITISAEEEAKLIAGYNEEKQILVATFKSIGLSFTDIKEAMDRGHNDMDAVLKYIEQRNASQQAHAEATPTDNPLLYRLNRNDKNAAALKDPSLSAYASESPKGLMHIEAASSEPALKQYLKLFEDNLFATQEKTPEELTILAAVGFSDAPQAAEFGLQIGNVSVPVTVPQDLVDSGAAPRTFTFRMYFRFDGSVKVEDETGNVALETDQGFNFEDISSVRYGVWLRTAGKVALKGFAVFAGHLGSMPSFWDEDAKDPPASVGLYVPFKQIRSNATAKALVSALGVEQDTALVLSQQYPELKQAIKAVLGAKLPLTPLTTDYGHNITDAVIVNSVGEIPAGYERAPIYENMIESQDYSGYSGKVVALKVSEERGKTFVKGFDIQNDSINVLREDKGLGAGVVSVLIIKVTDPSSVDIPAGYAVVGDNRGLNLTFESGAIHFLAYRTAFNFRLQPFTDLPQLPTRNSDGGLMDSFEQSSLVPATEFDTKRIAEEVIAMNGQSTVQLQTKLAALEKTYKREACFKLVLRLLRRWTDCVQDVDQLAKLLESSGTKYALFKPAISAVLSQPERASMMADALLEDVLTQLIGPIFAQASSALSKKTLSYESDHPYPNSYDKSEEIRIPGAKRLVVTFDSRCRSENNYDYLQFCRDKDFNSEICKGTGTTWQNFETEGDCMYYRFHSDGSNNEWGYQFTVTAAVATAVSTEYAEEDKARALWLLEEVVLAQSPLPAYFSRFVDREMLNALTLFAHSATDSDATLRVLFLLKRALEIPVEPVDDSLAVVSLLANETSTLYARESDKKEKSSLMKDAVGLVLELKEKYNITLSAEWFSNFYETFSFLKGVDTKDANFQFLLLKQFLESKGRSLDVVRESAHPYSNALTSKEVYSRGASEHLIEFSQESEAEPHHCVLITKDLEAREPVLSGSAVSFSGVQWASSPQGPNIAISNGGKSVTRTDSSGWGTVVSNTAFNAGKVKASFKIDNDGGSSYLYIGVIAADITALSDCTYKDWSNSHWMYKKTGEAHRRGFSQENSSLAYNTGDEVGVLLDFDDHTVTFSKNGTQTFQLTELAGPVVLAACFGGSSQHMSILSVQSASGDPSKLSQLKVRMPGERFYYHYPVNSGYLTHLQTCWTVEKNAQIALAEENKLMMRGPGSSDTSLVFSNTVLKAGRHFLEIEIVALPQETTLGFGLGLTDQWSLSVTYQSDGVLKKFGESFMSETYKEGDCVALLLSVAQAEMRVYKNGNQVTVLPRVALEEGKDFHWAVSTNGLASIRIKTLSPWTASLDLLGRSPLASVPTKYGYKFTAQPLFKGKNKLLAFDLLGNLQGEWEHYIKRQKHLFSKEVCEQLVNYVDEKCSTTDKDPMSLTPDDIAPTPQELVHFNQLEKLSLDDLKSIFKLIKDLNVQVTSALPLISLDLKEGSNSLTQLQRAFLHLRGFLFYKNKQSTLKEFIARTNTSDQPTIEINRTRAMRQKERGLVDSQGVSSIYGQIYRLMNKYPNRSLRHSERIYRVNFVGEGSIDAGGPYNEVITNMCEELMSRYLPLFVPCPNNEHNLGENRDAWLPNPSSDSPLHMDLYLFLGKLFGVAIRTQNNLNLSLPPAFWKRLIFDEVTIDDLKGFDECIFQTLNILRNMEAQGINAANFSAAFDGETFTTRDSSGRTVELCPDGANRLVTFENALEYADLLEKQRLTEAGAAYAAIRKGMSAIVPMNLLYMFSWKQVETLVCGAADINVDVLKGNTAYDGLSDSSPQIQMFWEVFREMTGKERSLFIRFVWGRSRLPAGKDFKQFKITNKSVSGIVDNYLPVSHTCFFTLDLPCYTSKQVMREKLVYAITHCQAIDLDRVAGAEGWEDE